MIGQTFSHYRIIEEIGKGGMGVVYLAEDTVLGRKVAIKTLTAGGPGRQHFRTRFLREARAVSALSHRHIATIHDYGETSEGEPFIVMELVKGKLLSDLIQERTLTLKRAMEIIIDVAGALSEAHRHGIVHRDIKPSNIAINEHGDVKVLDFGLAKHLDDTAAASPLGTTSMLGGAHVNEDGDLDARLDAHLPAQAQDLAPTRTREGVILCTPEYASPEQAMGLPVDARTDLFSLGSVLYECIAGARAFSGPTPNDVRAQVIRDDPPPPSTFNSLIPSELDRVTLKALTKKPDARYQTAEELKRDLRSTRKLLQQGEVARQVETPARTATNTSSLHAPQTRGLSRITAAFTNFRIPVLYLIIAAVMLGLATWGGWRLLRTQPHQPSLAAQRWYNEGTAALQDGTYYKASKSLEEATKQDSEFALARASLAEAWTELGYVDKANAEIAQANMLVDRSALRPIDALYLRAINASVSRDFKEAVESYHKMLQQAPESDKPYIYVDLARAYEKNEELKNAIDSYQEAIRRNSQYAPAFLRQGILYARQQDFSNAQAFFDEAFRLYGIQSNPEGLAEVLYQRGILFNSKGDTPKAKEELERALQVVKAFSSVAQQVKTMLQLSSVYRLLHDTDWAKRYTTEAIDLARANGLNDLTTQGLIELGTVFFFREDIGEAEKYFKQALELAQTSNTRVNVARALFSLGSLYVQQDNPDAGIPYLTQALPFFEQNGYRMDIMQSQTLLGQAYDLKGNYTQALTAFGVQLQLATQLNNRIQIARSHKGLGTVLAHQEKYTEALKHIEQSYSFYSAADNKLYAGYSLISRADVLWHLGRYEEAKASLSQASSLAEQPEGKFKQLWGRLYVVTAPMALSEQLYSKAIAEARKAIALDSSETKHPAIEAQYTLGLAQSLSGLKSQGRGTCEEAVERARRADDPRLLAGAQLALAEALFMSRDPIRALSMAKTAQQLFERSGQVESEWRAWLISGRASQLLGDNKAARESLLRADSQLSSLRQRWGGEYFETYVKRPDIKLYQEQLRGTSAGAQ